MDGWYLRTSPEHYRCHVVFIQKTRSERVSDTVVFKHRYVTTPTVTTDDKLLDMLRQVKAAITNTKQASDREELKSLTKLAHIWNTPSVKQVRFDDTAKPPRVESQHTTPGNRKHMQTNQATDRVTTRSMRRTLTKNTAIIDKPFATANNVTSTTTAVKRARLRTRLHNIATDRLTKTAQAVANIRRCNDNADMPEHVELANNIFDPETGQSLTYRKLIKHPKYKDVWTKSAANEFGRLAQGVGNRI